MPVWSTYRGACGLLKKDETRRAFSVDVFAAQKTTALEVPQGRVFVVAARFGYARALIASGDKCVLTKEFMRGVAACKSSGWLASHRLVMVAGNANELLNSGMGSFI